ncbi:hypothetical protein FHS27_005997 [Rhodopirellula rubra]|uniref:Uncharacterized protein n=1 Tax=Aporhodopirellula rubra TaxID=980271 RepID=A0A7W5E4Q1_9BACT|nr:hypothetical protein [Aporhodopirellula rubra]
MRSQHHRLNPHIHADRSVVSRLLVSAVGKGDSPGESVTQDSKSEIFRWEILSQLDCGSDIDEMQILRRARKTFGPIGTL